jgi:hypothetical protein
MVFVEEGLGQDVHERGICGQGVLNNARRPSRIRRRSDQDSRRGRFVRRIASWSVRRASS